MKLPTLTTVQPQNEKLLVELANMAGDSYLEELWVRELLSAMPQSSEGSDRERFLSRALVLNEAMAAAPSQSVHCTGDGYGLTIAYQRSELGTTSWAQLMKDASANLIASVFSDEEIDAYEQQQRRMEGVTVLDWVEREKAPGDFLHITLTAVDAEHRGSGTFRKLLEPVLTYADEAQLPIFLETYSDDLTALYEYFGFKVVHEFKSPEVSITQRCMRRDPQPQEA